MALSATPKQLRLMRFIAGFTLARGRAPTFAEMAEGCGMPARKDAHRVFRQLEERGLARSEAGQYRSAQLLAEVSIPRAPDGAPLFFVPNTGGNV